MLRTSTIIGLAVTASLAATAVPAWAAPANDDWEHAAVLGQAPVTIEGTRTRRAAANVSLAGAPTGRRDSVKSPCGS